MIILFKYLGQELQETHGSTYFEEGSLVSMPIIPYLDIILFPGQILPMTMFYGDTLAAIFREAITKEKTIGIICLKESNSKIGTTAEIIEYCTHRNNIRFKARGRQRFKLLGKLPVRERYMIILMFNWFFNFCFSSEIETVQILPEKTLSCVLQGAQTPSLNRFRKNNKFKKTMAQQDMCVFPWPQWILAHNDLKEVISKVLRMLNMLKIGKQ